MDALDSRRRPSNAAQPQLAKRQLRGRHESSCGAAARLVDVDAASVVMDGEGRHKRRTRRSQRRRAPATRPAAAAFDASAASAPARGADHQPLVVVQLKFVRRPRADAAADDTLIAVVATPGPPPPTPKSSAGAPRGRVADLEAAAIDARGRRRPRARARDGEVEVVCGDGRGGPSASVGRQVAVTGGGSRCVGVARSEPSNASCH